MDELKSAYLNHVQIAYLFIHFFFFGSFVESVQVEQICCLTDPQNSLLEKPIFQVYWTGKRPWGWPGVYYIWDYTVWDWYQQGNTEWHHFEKGYPGCSTTYALIKKRARRSINQWLNAYFLSDDTQRKRTILEFEWQWQICVCRKREVNSSQNISFNLCK